LKVRSQLIDGTGPEGANIVSLFFCFLIRMIAITILLVALSSCRGYPDYFNFEETIIAEDTYGPADWSKVACLDVDTCVS
jgi:hypothetical protein